MIIFLLILYLSIYPLLFSLIQNYFFFQNDFIKIVISSPLIWHITEFLRGHLFTGFPWLQIGYSHINSPLKGLAPLFGVEGITFTSILISSIISYALIKKNIQSIILVVFFFIIMLFLSNIKWYKINTKLPIQISLVQANILNTFKINNNIKNKILKKYEKLSEPLMYKNSVIIWPESAIPYTEIECQEFIKSMDQKLRNKKSILITGIIDYIRNRKIYFNTILILGNKKYNYKTHENYKKYNLVPFGEFFPYKKLSKIINFTFNIDFFSFNKGSYLQPQINFLNYKANANICYEIIFGKRIKENFKEDSNFIINISNDAWFDNSIGPWQHLQILRMRSLELGRPILRATNNGITAVIQANGEIYKKIPQFVTDVLTTQIYATYGKTPYVKFGSLFLSIINYFFLSIIIFFKVKKYFN